MRANSCDATLNLADRIDRLLLRLVVRPGKHLANETKRDQLNPAYNEQNRSEEHWPMFLHDFNVLNELSIGQKQTRRAARGSAQ